MKNAASEVIYVVYILDFINSQLKSNSTCSTIDNTYNLLQILIVIYNLTWLEVLMHSWGHKCSLRKKKQAERPGFIPVLLGCAWNGLSVELARHQFCYTHEINREAWREGREGGGGQAGAGWKKKILRKSTLQRFFYKL